MAVTLARRRHGLVYGVGNVGKFIGPAGLALLGGTSNYVTPKATLDALIPVFDYSAFWSGSAANAHPNADRLAP